MRSLRALLLTLAAATPLAAQGGTLIVYNAGSLAVPLRAALDSFALARPITVQQENAGSLETARKLTELHKIPDLIALADYQVFPQLLMPQYVSSYYEFARNRMVIAFTRKSKFAPEMNATTWTSILQRAGVETGRADPSTDPNGYRTLLTLQLAEIFYAQPGLADRIVAASPARNMRPNEASLVGLLQAGELDYIWSYESIAQAAGIEYLTLPADIDLSDPAKTDVYAKASVRVAGRTPRDSITFHGEPIVYAIAIPIAAPHRDLAESFLMWLFSPAGIRALRAAKLDALDTHIVVPKPGLR